MATDTNDEKKEGDLKSFLKKIFWWGLGILVAIIAALAWLGGNPDKFLAWQEERYDKAMKDYENKLVAQYTADKDGGSTPEETIDLLVSALKAGDIEQASRYYTLGKQQEEYLFLNDILQKSNSLDQSTNFYIDLKKNGKLDCDEEMSSCVLEYYYVSTEDRVLEVRGRNERILIPAGEESLRSTSFSFNKYSNVWKIGTPEI